MCTSPVRNATVPVGIASRSRKPTSAAATAPVTPMPINHIEPTARIAGDVTMCEATSKTRLASHAPIGTVTSIGWNGWP